MSSVQVDGTTALDLAQSRGHRSVVKLLSGGDVAAKPPSRCPPKAPSVREPAERDMDCGMGSGAGSGVGVSTDSESLVCLCERVWVCGCVCACVCDQSVVHRRKRDPGSNCTVRLCRSERGISPSTMSYGHCIRRMARRL